MNNNDERSIVAVDSDRCHAQVDNVASVPNSSTSTVNIDSLCIELDIVKEKGTENAQKCRHFSIRGYVSGMRERGNNNFLPFAEQLPPIDVPQFRYWLCQRCLQNCEAANNTKGTSGVKLKSVDRVAALPFGEGTSGVKPVDNENDDDDENIVADLESDENESESSQEILPAKDNIIAEETLSNLVGPPVESGQQNDYPNGHPKRKARKVRLLKELLSGNTEIQQRKKENSAIRLVQTPSSSPPIKRKILQDQDHDRIISVDKKLKSTKGNPVAKTILAEHCKDPIITEGGENSNNNKYQWNKHGTQRSSILGKVGGDPVTAWRSIFSDMARPDTNQHATPGGVGVGGSTSRPIYDNISKGRGATEPYSNLMGPPPPQPPPNPHKKFNLSKKMSKNSLKRKFFIEESRKINVGGSRNKNPQSETELGLGLSLKYDPQAQVQSQVQSQVHLGQNHDPTQDHGRKTGFYFGESSIPHRIPLDSKAKEGFVPRTTFLQEQQRSYTQVPYGGGCSGHQKLNFSDPYKRNTGVRMYSDVIRPLNHEQHENNMFSVGRSDEREIIELMAKNQYERSLCHRPPGSPPVNPPGSTNNRIIMPNSSSYPTKFSMLNEGIPEYYNNVGPTRNPPAGGGFYHHPPHYHHQDHHHHHHQGSSFNMFDAFSQSQKHPQPQQPTNGMWVPDSGSKRSYHDPCYHHHNHHTSRSNKIPDSHFYTTTAANMKIPDSHFNNYRNNNGTYPNEAYVRSCIEKDNHNKGKNIMDLDLNVVAPNSIEEPNNNNWGSLDSSRMVDPQNPKHNFNNNNLSSLDSSYSNEAIPAMQLLSLMDAGKTSHHHHHHHNNPHHNHHSNHNPFIMNNGRKFTTAKPISPTRGTYNNPNHNTNSSFSYSGLRPKNHNNPNPNPNFFFYKPQETMKPPPPPPPSNLPPRGSHHHQSESSDHYPRGGSHHRPELSSDHPRGTHRSELSDSIHGGAYRPRMDENIGVCTLNKNPADFTSPGPKNEYMIGAEDLKFGMENRCNNNNGGQKRPKKVAMKPAS